MALTDLIDKLPTARCLVVGDLMVDEYVWGDVTRVCPEAPVPVLDVQRTSYRPGGAANTAANIQSLGATVKLLGVVGSDRSAGNLRGALHEAGCTSTRLIIDEDRCTTTKTRFLGHNHLVLRADSECRLALSASVASELILAVEASLGDVDVLVLSDYAKGVLTGSVSSEVIALARQNDVPVVVDPKGVGFHRYRGATVLTPNLLELSKEAGLSVSLVSIDEGAKRLREVLPATSLVVTLGAHGMRLFVNDCTVDVPALARTVFDVTGAGDTTVAVLSAALAVGANLPDAAQLATIAAAIVIESVGTSTVTLDELMARATELAQRPAAI